MEQIKTYYNFALNDYIFLQESVESGLVYNGMCSMAQNCAERFLKHIIEPFATIQNNTTIMRANDLTTLKSFITANLSEFTGEWGKIMLCNGYYFSARYPGNNAIFAKEQDVKDCWLAVTAAKIAVEQYMNTKEWLAITNQLSPSKSDIEEIIAETIEDKEDYSE